MTFNEGDHVYIYGSGRGDIRKAVVSRVTKTQAIIEDDRYANRFNRETGRLVGASAWTSTYISHPTPGLDKNYQEQKIRRAAFHLSNEARSLDTEKIRAAYAAWDQLVREEHSNDQ